MLAYDALAFHAYLETIIATNTRNETGQLRQNQSPWLLTDAAHIIFSYAKRRCYTMTTAAPAPAPAADRADDQAGWEVLDEMEGRPRTSSGVPQPPKRPLRPTWLPKGMEPVLEELPKWDLLADVLHEIETEMMRLESQLTSRAFCDMSVHIVSC